MDGFAQIGQWANENEGLLQAVAMVVGVLGVLCSALWRIFHSRKPQAAASEAVSAAANEDLLKRPAVAVLPFSDLSGEGDHQYLADGLAEELITSLSYWRRFPVIARSASFAWRGEHDDLRDIGQALGARYILEGSVRRDADRVRVTARLCEAGSGHQLWSRGYDGESNQLFDFQAEIASEIVRGIEPEIGRAETDRAGRKAPADMDCWDDCLQASAYIHTGTREGLQRARKLIDQALKLEPGSSLANSLNALWCFSEALQAWTKDPPRVLARAHDAARHAHELDKRDWLPLSLLGITTLWVERNYELGIELEQRALELNPSAASAYQFLGCIQQFKGEPEEALASQHAASRLNPSLQSTGLALSDIALCHLLLGNREDAEENGRRAVAADPQNARAAQRLLAILGHFQSPEASQQLTALQVLQPDMDLAYIDATYPFLRPEDRQLFLQGLEAAGWQSGG